MAPSSCHDAGPVRKLMTSERQYREQIGEASKRGVLGDLSGKGTADVFLNSGAFVF